MCAHLFAQMNRWHTPMQTNRCSFSNKYTHLYTYTHPPSHCVNKLVTVVLMKKNFPSSFQSGCDSDRLFSCGHTKTMSAWRAINLRATFIKNTAALLPQQVYLTWVTGWVLLKTQVMAFAPLPVFKWINTWRCGVTEFFLWWNKHFYCVGLFHFLAHNLNMSCLSQNNKNNRCSLMMWSSMWSDDLFTS